jgi:HAD superfamily 5'-nucleotidase-like hydrolase
MLTQILLLLTLVASHAIMASAFVPFQARHFDNSLWRSKPFQKASHLSAEVVKSENPSILASRSKDIPDSLMSLPRHSHEGVNNILIKTENALRGLHHYAEKIDVAYGKSSTEKSVVSESLVYSNSYVDLAKIDIIGFDYDYTLVTYTNELLELIYDMALNRLVEKLQYPLEMLSAGLKYDPNFSIRGLAVDKETAWICHLSYTHKVAVAWEGRQKVPTSRVYSEYRGKRVMNPAERKSRIKPLNDLFSMAECCLIADTVQFFLDNNIPYCPKNCVADILSTIGTTHMSGDFHRIVAENPEKYFEPTPHLKELLENLKNAGKRLIFVSNSPFWYVDKGMKYVIGENWRDSWDAVICTAGKPNFYLDDDRPFREVCQETGRIKFDNVGESSTRRLHWSDDHTLIIFPSPFILSSLLWK